MAMSFFVFVAATVFLATTSGAPTEDGGEALKVHPNCQDKGFCPFQPEGYEQYVDKMNSVLPKSLIQDYSDRISAELRPPTLSAKEDWDNCPYWTKNEQMFTYSHGLNNSKTEIIVQTNLFRQIIETVTCARENIPASTIGVEECFRDLNLGLGKSAFDMTFTCENSYARRSLYVFDVANAKIIQKTFLVPSCCSCKVNS